MKLTSSDYLRCILRTPIRQIAECPNSCEVRMGGRGGCGGREERVWRERGEGVEVGRRVCGGREERVWR